MGYTWLTLHLVEWVDIQKKNKRSMDLDDLLADSSGYDNKKYTKDPSCQLL